MTGEGKRGRGEEEGGWGGVGGGKREGRGWVGWGGRGEDWGEDWGGGGGGWGLGWGWGWGWGAVDLHEKLGERKADLQARGTEGARLSRVRVGAGIVVRERVRARVRVR